MRTTYPNPAWMADADGNFYWYNKQWYDYTGTTLEEMQGWGWQKVHHPDYIEIVTEEWQSKLKSRQPFEKVFPLRGKDGKYRWFLTRAMPIKDKNGKIVRWLGTNTDITEHKRAEEALRSTGDYLESLINFANAPIIVWDPALRITRFNHAFEHLTGYSSHEVVGKELDMLFPEDSREESLVKIRRTLAEHWESVEIPILCMDGGTRIALWNSANVYGNDGKTLLATIAQGQDITERKKVEEELVEAKKQAELYVDLMGHDINNLNQIALGYLELAIEIVKDDEIKELVVKPLDAIQNSSKLIENVRKLQKVKTGGLKIEAIDLDGLLAELRNQYLNVPGKDVAIDYDPCRDCYVMANGLLRDVFANLIGNAIKHSGPTKSVWIGLGLERYKEDGKEYCKVIVEDDGPGIPDTLKEKVFARFRKENAKAGGKGLGLYLVKSLVEDFHGTVHVEDRVPGDHTKGARFVVMLPAVEQ